MNKKISVGMAVTLAAIVTTIAITLTYTFAINTFENRMRSVTERQATNDLLAEIDGKIRQKFYGRIDETELGRSMASGMAKGLGDDNCAYLSPEEWELQKNRLAGYDFGLGLDVSRADDGNIMVRRVTPGSPAAGAGILKGDVITYVGSGTMEFSTVLSVGYDKAVAAMASPSASVRLRVKRGDREINFEVTKSKYDIVAVDWTLIGGNVGRINIYTLCARTLAQFNAAYSAARQAGAKGLMLDLRENAGDGYEYACEVLNTLLPQGNLLSFVDSSGTAKVLYSSDARMIDMPICVLIGGKTAGAAELFCSNMADYNKGRLIGTPTKGLLTMQEYFPLSDGSAIKLTTGLWKTDKGSAVKDGRITPEDKYIIPLSAYQQENLLLLSPEEDPQVQEGLKYLADAIARKEAEQPDQPSDEPVSYADQPIDEPVFDEPVAEE
ncbi:MAG: S41 family peptidase [Oscillospiraceae bacterium]|nr:S41 family peptidase [Oscillospiraceae bacterium]